MQGEKAIAWHNLVVEINVYISCMAYTRTPNIPPVAGRRRLWRGRMPWCDEQHGSRRGHGLLDDRLQHAVQLSGHLVQLRILVGCEDRRRLDVDERGRPVRVLVDIQSHGRFETDLHIGMKHPDSEVRPVEHQHLIARDGLPECRRTGLRIGMTDEAHLVMRNGLLQRGGKGGKGRPCRQLDTTCEGLIRAHWWRVQCTEEYDPQSTHDHCRSPH